MGWIQCQPQAERDNLPERGLARVHTCMYLYSINNDCTCILDFARSSEIGITMIKQPIK